MIRALVLIGLIAGAVLAAGHLGLLELRDPQRLTTAIRSARGIRAIGPIFVAVYAIVAAFGLPVTPFTLAGGAIFGVWLGSFLNWCGALIGASGSFVLASVLGRDAAVRLLGTRAGAIQAALDRGGLAVMFRLRLLPLVPFNVLSFAAALAGVPFRAYVLGTALGIVPGTVVYTYFADSLIGGAQGASMVALIRVAAAAVLLLALSFAPSLVRRLRRDRH